MKQTNKQTNKQTINTIFSHETHHWNSNHTYIDALLCHIHIV